MYKKELRACEARCLKALHFGEIGSLLDQTVKQRRQKDGKCFLRWTAALINHASDQSAARIQLRDVAHRHMACLC